MMKTIRKTIIPTIAPDMLLSVKSIAAFPKEAAEPSQKTTIMKKPVLESVFIKNKREAASKIKPNVTKPTGFHPIKNKNIPPNISIAATKISSNSSSLLITLHLFQKLLFPDYTFYFDI